jgi:hypothetical protein
LIRNSTPHVLLSRIDAADGILGMLRSAVAGYGLAEEWQPLEATVPKDIFKAEVMAWADKIGVGPEQLHVRPMRRKWGNCPTAGRVTFDTELPTPRFPRHRNDETARENFEALFVTHENGPAFGGI